MTAPAQLDPTPQVVRAVPSVPPTAPQGRSIQHMYAEAVHVIQQRYDQAMAEVAALAGSGAARR